MDIQKLRDSAPNVLMIFSILLGLSFAVFGLVLMFGDIAGGTSGFSLYFAVAGFVIGLITPRRWWLSGLVAVGAVCMFVGLIPGIFREGMGAMDSLLLLLPLPAALLGGWVGGLLSASAGGWLKRSVR